MEDAVTRISFERTEKGVRARVPQRGRDLLNQCLVNKGTAFSAEERRAFGVEGLLPSFVTDIEKQLRRVHGSIFRKPEPLERYIGMASLQDRK
jgi:hypothetical protein